MGIDKGHSVKMTRTQVFFGSFWYFSFSFSFFSCLSSLAVMNNDKIRNAVPYFRAILSFYCHETQFDFRFSYTSQVQGDQMIVTEHRIIVLITSMVKFVCFIRFYISVKFSFLIVFIVKISICVCVNLPMNSFRMRRHTTRHQSSGRSIVKSMIFHQTFQSVPLKDVSFKRSFGEKESLKIKSWTIVEKKLNIKTWIWLNKS